MGKYRTNQSITTYRILDTTILNADVNTAASIDFSKLATLTAANILVGNASAVPTSVAMSGDAAISNAGAVSLASYTVKYATVEISSAEILALFTTPKSLVAAPGVGYVLDFISLLLAYDYGTVAYTIGTATNLQVKYTDGAGAASSVTQAVTGMIDQATDQIRHLDKLESSITPVANAALVLTLAVANPTAGNGTIHVKVIYRTLATSL